MADNIISTFLVALGFDDAAASSMVAKTKKSMADYERAVKEAEKRIEDAKWEGAKTQEEIAKLTRETNLKEARAALASAQEREKSEKETAKKREERHKEFAAGMNRMALAATAAATAIGFAVSKVADAFDNLGFVSKRTGASVQSLNSLGYAFKQTGGSAQQAISAVEKFAQALRGNDGLKTFVQGLGVDTKKDMGDQYLDTITALSKHPYQVGMREAGMLGIGEEDYKLVTDHIRQIREYREEYNRTTRALGVDSDKAAEASQTFWRSLNRLQATASALSDKLMISLAPAIEAIVRRINDWIAANPEKVEKIMRGIGEATDAIAGGLNKVADWFGDEGNQRAIAEFWDKFNKYVRDSVKEITNLLGLFDKIGRYIGLKPGDDPIGVLATRALGNQQQVASGDTSAGKTYTPLLQRGLNAVKRTLGIGGDASGGVSANPGAYKDVLDHIARSEGTANSPGGGYNTSLAHGLLLPDGKEQDLTKLTLDQIDALQTGMLKNPANRWNSSAIGRYQIVRTTLRDQRRKLGLLGSDLYDAALQDRVAANLARQRGADPVGLQNEWASLVGAKNGVAVDLMRRVDLRAATAPVQASPRFNSMPLGGFDPNNIDPKNLMRPAPSAASPTTNNSTSNRAVHQTINNTTTITGTDRPKEAARVMESAFGRMHGLALANAQSAVT